MRWLWLALLLIGCAVAGHRWGGHRGRQIISDFRELPEYKDLRYEIEGLRIRVWAAEGMDVPGQAVIVGEFQGVLNRLGLAEGAILMEYIDVLFTTDWINCEKSVRRGCTWGNMMMVRLVGGPQEWRWVLAHEFGHILLLRTHTDGDGDHLMKEYWRVVNNVDARQQFRCEQ